MASATDTVSAGSRPVGGVVTRFAPSPTGFLHIGGARTALFNWLYARHHGGTYLLRIEDTDRARSTDAAIDAIFDGLEWLGLGGDEPPVFQFARSDRHAQVAHQMLDAGHAYRCYLTQEELAARREQALAERRPFRIDSEWREATPDQWPQGAPYVVRMKSPREGETVIADQVQGSITVQNGELDDFVILRSDGTPTYMLAVVVDDHDMGVTHVIRGDDHINNAFRQLVVIRAMQDIEGTWPDPVYAHIPLIHGADGAKLSKRHGALGVDAYRDEMGLLPEAVFNYLLRLGWGHGDEEIISRDQAVEWFDIIDVNKGASRFDLKKLLNLNGQYIREADDTRLAALVAKRLEALAPGFSAESGLDLLTRAMPVLKVRAADLNELAQGAVFLFARRPLPLAEKAAVILNDDARAILSQVATVLEGENGWTTEDLEATVKQMAEGLGIGLGKIAQPLRASLTGQATSPGIFDVLALLGRDESLARIRDHAA
ncbi:glutamate--tRNA ligase [Novosphingobium sp. CECT 9465]|uniref:glutamate--tRNA ligase n=1 Tax=Novosphingobium sp. CECT 9465 TaxID=2829794 RepID=UPI001E3768C0|nr:glutamate--tRNA ligase [Novosphingobium sp. CECT 9465]CAH0496585.1 Glutamate--tRNA ligase [Novosphingobium sp. CECT 9465]